MDWQKLKTHKEERWKITYTNNLGLATNYRFVYMQMGFSSKELAEKELRLILKRKTENSTDHDYRVESYISNTLDIPINPFKED